MEFKEESESFMARGTSNEEIRDLAEVLGEHVSRGVSIEHKNLSTVNSKTSLQFSWCDERCFRDRVDSYSYLNLLGRNPEEYSMLDHVPGAQTFTRVTC